MPLSIFSLTHSPIFFTSFPSRPKKSDEDEEEEETEEETSSEEETTSSEEETSDEEEEDEEEDDIESTAKPETALSSSDAAATVKSVDELITAVAKDTPSTSDGTAAPSGTVEVVMETIEEKSLAADEDRESLSSSSSQITISTPSEEPSGSSSGKALLSVGADVGLMNAFLADQPSIL